MKVLLIGADGQVGFELWRTLQFNREVIPTTSDGRDVQGMTTIKLDLSDAADIEKKIDNIKPDVVCNAAAYTQVDQAESDTEMARLINAEAVSVMAHSAKKNKCLLIHYSTDYVFSGEHKFPWKEKDVTNPKSIYGQTKLNGEQAIIGSQCEYMIFRTAWVFSNRRNNFLNTMLRLAESHPQLKVVNDQQGAPTWASTIALATMLALNIPQTGLYHLTSNGSTTWFGFAQKIFNQAERVGLIEKQPELIPISSKDFPTDAERPKYSVLNCRKFEGIFNVKLPHWQTTLQLCMQQRIKP